MGKDVTLTVDVPDEKPDVDNRLSRHRIRIHKETIRKVPSGTIDMAVGADGVYLQFNCDCSDALPYCKAACCCLPGIEVEKDELCTDLDKMTLPVVTNEEGNEEMKRGADGFCVLNSPTTKLCTRYDERPETCREFHCSRGHGMRGWRLDLNRHVDIE